MGLSGKELELFESIEFYLALIGALPLPVFMVDEQNRCHTLSNLSKPALEKLATIAPGTGNSWDLDMDDDESVIIEAVKKARIAKKQVSIKGKWKYKKTILGNEMMVIAHATPTTINGKEYVIVVAEDTTELEKLKGLLSVCMSCKKIYDNKRGNWDTLEHYISSETTAGFSHGLCPDCSKEMIKDLEEQNIISKGVKEYDKQ